jgi:hypothetical protein
MVPHFLAADVVSDNRLMPQASWVSSHLFASPCANPIVTATLRYRPYPLWLARERDWELYDHVMAKVIK